MKHLIHLLKQAVSGVALLLILALLFPVQTAHAAEPGEENFKTLCASCHQASSKRTVGPGLKGITERRSEEWLLKWIKDSQRFVASGDPDAKAIFDEYFGSGMPAFPQLSDADIKDLLAYIEIEGAKAVDEDPTVAAAPGPAPYDPVRRWMSDLTMWGVIFLVILAIVAVRLNAFTRAKIEANGHFPSPFSMKYHGFTFLAMTVAAVGLIYLIVLGLKDGPNVLKMLFFGGFPYLAVAIFLIGTIYRYRARGFQVSSLSTQFLEGKQLFWGSQPFHWGLLFLFFGHLIAFLFPDALMAWNGMPMRLLILEASSFVFGLSALVGLIVLINRRFSKKRLVVLSNKMDMLVYVVLLTQIATGLGVAVFARWGSSWFASTLTPYLRSLFVLNPEVDVLGAMPWVLQIHVISAFFILAIIPFTRFMHFMVAPVAYIWRRYQVVIWNWNHKRIRNSRQHTFGRKPKNH